MLTSLSRSRATEPATCGRAPSSTSASQRSAIRASTTLIGSRKEDGTGWIECRCSSRLASSSEPKPCGGGRRRAARRVDSATEPSVSTIWRTRRAAPNVHTSSRPASSGYRNPAAVGSTPDSSARTCLRMSGRGQAWSGSRACEMSEMSALSHLASRFSTGSKLTGRPRASLGGAGEGKFAEPRPQ
ncbi:hypothetical protein MAPG_02081 [Magnaporthiopsis poae ATCC 64411]|uniref:Uncharacterized protein n=1 Tax=Magnaporthiopsis poae (strain ATCC 64411 / 73-15) TaxID=644358 RepID=A0A0C4DQE1_MAGP6|nr:hypothetical protein MAPG_02081 [Magnaporthiopsis poae ATCC 64411]